MICFKKNQEIRAKIFRTFFSMQCPVCQAKVIPVRLELSWVCWRIGCAAAASFFEATSTVCVCVCMYGGQDHCHTERSIQRLCSRLPPVSAAAIAVVVVVYRPTIHRAPTFRSQIVTANGFAVARWLFRQKRRI